jgi:uncharacterized protein involved in cysteine biosynthesis
MIRLGTWQWKVFSVLFWAIGLGVPAVLAVFVLKGLWPFMPHLSTGKQLLVVVGLGLTAAFSWFVERATRPLTKRIPDWLLYSSVILIAVAAFKVLIYQLRK